jgi:hypothetical protein
MSWRTGAAMFREMWPTMQKHLACDDEEWRVEFLAAVLKVFLECDMCPNDVQHIHPEIDRALEIADPPL